MTKATKIALVVFILGLLGVVVVVALVLSMSSSGPTYRSQNSNSQRHNSNAGPKPSPTSERIQLRLDKILEQMAQANIAFNAPTKMKLDSPSTIQLVLSPSNSIEELKELITAEGEKEGAQIRISDRMEAHLSGTAFQISTITPELQAVTWNAPTEWKWEVQPTQYGRHNLHLTLTAIITTKDSSMPRTIRTFDKTIEVEVSSWWRGFLLFRENWEWMWTLLALPVGAWLWRRRQIKKSNPAEIQKPPKKRRRLSTLRKAFLRRRHR